MTDNQHNKESMHQAKSTIAAEEHPTLPTSHIKSPIKTFLSNAFCLCYPKKMDFFDNPKFQKEEKTTKTNVFYDYKEPFSQISRLTMISDQEVLKKPKHRDKHAIFRQKLLNLSDFQKKYPQKSLFFLNDNSKKHVFLAKCEEIQFDLKKPHSASKNQMTKSCTETDKALMDEINALKGVYSRALGHIFKSHMSGLGLLITGKEPEANILRQIDKTVDFLMILKKASKSRALQIPPFEYDKIECLETNLFKSEKKVFYNAKVDYVILDLFSQGILNVFEELEEDDLYFALENQINEAFAYSENLIFIIPCIPDLSLLITILSEITTEGAYLNNQYPCYGLEIQAIAIGATLELYIIYFGNRFKGITKEKTVSFLSNFLNKDSSFVNNIPNINHFLGHLSERIGFHQIFKYVLEAEEHRCSSSETLFLSFLDILKDSGTLDKEEQQEILQEHIEKSHPAPHLKEETYNTLGLSFKKNMMRATNSKECLFLREKTPDFDSLMRKLHRRPYEKYSKKSVFSTDNNNSFSSYTDNNIDLGSIESNKLGEGSLKTPTLAREKSI